MRGLHVLVIEDEVRILDLLRVYLEQDGYEVTATDSPLGAVGLARRLHPDVILLDLGLPYRSGLALLLDLKADRGTARIPIVVASGLPELLTGERRALVFAVLPKPVHLGTLSEVLRAACNPSVRGTPS